MILVLEVAVAHEGAPRAGRHQFDERGGTLGRDPQNTWVLPHPKVSAHHAVISWREGVFYIEDRSTNGVFVNAPSNRLTRHRAHALSAGDRLFIGPYEIDVSVTGSRREASPAPTRAQDWGRGSSAASSNAGVMRGDPEPVDIEIVDPLKLLPDLDQPPQSRDRARPAIDRDAGSPVDANFVAPRAIRDPAMGPLTSNPVPDGYDPLATREPPSIAPASARGSDSTIDRPAQARPHVEIPQGYDPLSSHREEPSVDDGARLAGETAKSVSVDPPKPPAVQVHTPPDRDGDDAASASSFADVLAGAGLDPAVVTPDVARDFGRILRVVVSGLIDVLRARQEIKEEFRMRLTQFKPAENNPLKFSVNVDDALHNLLVKQNPAYLRPVEAFDDAFADVRGHQLAMLAGMRVAFEALLADFDPARLQEAFDRQGGTGLLPAKLRYWELYRDKLEAILKDRDGAFRRLFGEEFARAYEDQLRQIKSQSRRGDAGPSIGPDRPDR